MKKTILIAGILLSGLLLIINNAEADKRLPLNTLKSPYPVYMELPNGLNIKTDNSNCLTPPTPSYDLIFTSVYTDKSNGVSIVDKKAQKKYRSQISKLKKYETQIYKWIESGFTGDTNGDHNIACAISWLKDWAEGNSLLNGKTNFQGEAVRKWTLASLSSHYLQIKHLPNIDTNDKKTIEKWLKRLAKVVIQDYERNPESKSRNNNHMYWATWSVMITSIALNDIHFYRWSRKYFKEALESIQADGTLPLELYREGKAFHYHVFAAGPLVLMAETVTRNGHDMYEYRHGSLKRLINRILEEIENDQSYITNLINVEQNLNRTLTSGNLAWLEVYNTRYPSETAQIWLDNLRPMVQRRLGGNLTRLYLTTDFELEKHK